MSVKNYVIAWRCLGIVLRKGYNIKSWIAPIPEEHKARMIELGRKHFLGGKKIWKM